MSLSARRAVRRLRRVHPATYIATLALVVAVSGVSPADAVNAVKRAVFAQNAGSVNGIKASRTPKPGRLLALGSNGKFTPSAVQSAPRGPRGALGPVGPVGPAGPQGDRGPSSARIVTPGDVNLSRSTDVTVPVATLSSVAGGSYLAMFTGEAAYRAAGVRMYVVCELRVNGSVVATTKGIVGEVPGSTGSLNLALVRPITHADPFDLSVTCYPDQPAVDGQPGGVIEGQALAVVKLDSVTTG
jgi:hypothetical protein